MVFLIGFRILSVMMTCGIFLPPDNQNPHILADMTLMIAGGLFWAVGDIAAHDLRAK
jgi:hypothetical protein